MIFLLALGAALTPLAARQGEVLSFSLFFSTVIPPAVYTVKIAALSTCIALLVGIPAAFFTANRTFAGRRFLLVLSAVPLSVPTLLIALGFVGVFGIGGSFNRMLKAVSLYTGFALQSEPVSFLYSFWGIIIVQGFYNFPLVMRLCSDLWQRLPQEEADAARLLGASEWKVFRTVTLYQLAPTIASSAMLVFLYCFFSFIIVLLFGSAGGTTLEVAVYRSVRTSLNFKEGALFALTETFIALCFVFLYSRFEQKGRRSSGLTGTKKTAENRPLQTKKEYALFAVVFIPVILFFLWPLFAVLKNAVTYKGSLSLAAFLQLFSRPAFWTALLNTVKSAAAAAAAAVTAGSVFALFVHKIDPFKTKVQLRFIPLIPMAVSSIVLGFGIIVLVKQGSPLTLIAVQSALLWPLAFRYVSSAVDRIPELTLDAARLLSPDPLDSVFRIQIPLLYRSIISAFGFCFAAASADASLPLLLSIPRFETLALFTYRLAGAYRFNEACAAGSVLGFLAIAFFILGDRLK
ncbi:iron ABC transporter permease [Treponema sp. OMZ 840]|uniref:ABC transporter permease n=1 Tax=Treponema sp. OMZ 840 TaxID=244313 RepID=UPI003D920DD1